ncbi:RNA polymerase sigma factor [uncultured Sunxiuqinia sp.]|uniref:RNA polymerase sigma factor n=1 Tax=uncultured Sunxiuqinia sp. TaxID=1573825 RepID=UPI002AA7F1BE|nr:RNA polymerase sigma factor [uncultured Sunxiuqinia sp.]
MFGREKKIKSNEKLMQRIRHGDQEAFNELYERYKDRLYYYFFRMLNSESQANDFLQDLFLKIIEKPGRFNPAYPFKTWVFSVAYNLCKNEYRRREVRKEIYHGDSHVNPVLPESITEEELVNSIFKSLDSLSPEHRSVFIMHYREGFPIKEIAGMLETAPGTVKSRLFYTRKYLAEKFQHLKGEIEF